MDTSNDGHRFKYSGVRAVHGDLTGVFVCQYCLFEYVRGVVELGKCLSDEEKLIKELLE